MSLSLKDSLDLIETVESRLNSYWNFYLFVAVATIGWLMSAGKPFTEPQGKNLALVVALLMTAHLSVMVAATHRIEALCAEALAFTGSEGAQSERLKAHLSSTWARFRLPASIAVHFALDAGLLYAIIEKGIN